ncbi:hypothetical protein IE4872_CH00595 [Rhizobium gallicum]|uniref:Uncharacterized protein n=1 Tax=Rhizobium gallicum TaxID=56730 RepID=A0A1L5NED2_9HYPH|nr:hypothetical protein IE4872_CH00595 [Rhizobium gallicum]
MGLPIRQHGQEEVAEELEGVHRQPWPASADQNAFLIPAGSPALVTCSLATLYSRPAASAELEAKLLANWRRCFSGR